MSVATRPECAWSVSGAGDWLTLLSPVTATGPAAVEFSVSANTGASREKGLTVAGHAFTVREDAAAVACTFAIDPDRREMTANGGAGSVSVATGADCTWTALSGASWIVVAGNGDGRGPGAVSYTVSENNTRATRTGTIAIAGRTHTVEQRSETVTPTCEYQVSPVQFSSCMPAWTGTATVTTRDSCRWSASSDASWLTITSGRSGSGSGRIVLAWTDNYRAPRQGVVMVRWSTPTLGQNIHVDQAGCSYTVIPSAADVASAGGTHSFDVWQMADPNTCGGPLQDRCIWTARSDVPWIVVTTGMPRSGDNPFTVTVAPNTGAARTGHVTVADKKVTVRQAAP